MNRFEDRIIRQGEELGKTDRSGRRSGERILRRRGRRDGGAKTLSLRLIKTICRLDWSRSLLVVRRLIERFVAQLRQAIQKYLNTPSGRVVWITGTYSQLGALTVWDWSHEPLVETDEETPYGALERPDKNLVLQGKRLTQHDKGIKVHDGIYDAAHERCTFLHKRYKAVHSGGDVGVNPGDDNQQPRTGRDGLCFQLPWDFIKYSQQAIEQSVGFGLQHWWRQAGMVSRYKGQG